MLYNIIRVGDDVTASTYRKVTIGNSANVEKIRLTLCISVESIDYDGDGQEIRLRGRNRTETEHVKLGAYHTLEIAPSRSLTVRKHEPWDKISLEKLAEAGRSKPLSTYTQAEWESWQDMPAVNARGLVPVKAGDIVEVFPDRPFCTGSHDRGKAYSIGGRT